MAAPKKRLLDSWLSAFLEYTERVSSQPIFRKWAGIGTLAAALERKVWIVSQKRRVYPNLYIFLVGPPGTGKTIALDIGSSILKASLPAHFIAETSLTKAALIDALAAANRLIRYPEEASFNALFIPSHELGALLPQYDPDFLNALTHIYDNSVYDERRRVVRHGVPLVIESPVLNLVAATTPSYMNTSLPVNAWDQGFLSRVIIAFGDISSEAPLIELDLMNEGEDENTELKKALQHDMRIIGERYGCLKFERNAAKAMEAWYKKGCPWNDRGDKPTHPRLTYYKTRRPIHALKLCMIACCDRGGDSINIVDVETAKDWLIEVEREMSGVFTAMQSGGDAAVIRDAWHFVLTDNARFPQGTPLSRLLEFLQNRVHAPYVERVYKTMVEANIIKVYPGPDNTPTVRVVSSQYGTMRTMPKG